MRPARQRTPGQPGPPALATHPQPAQALVDVGQLERSHLPGPQASQQHRQRDRPVAVGRKVSKERGHLRGVQRLRQPLGRSHQPPPLRRRPGPSWPSTPRRWPATPGPAAARAPGSQPGRRAQHNLVLEQRPHCRHPPVDR
jgi:hypothetical protein